MRYNSNCLNVYCTHGPYKITSNIKKTLCKYYQYHGEINYIEEIE